MTVTVLLSHHFNISIGPLCLKTDSPGFSLAVMTDPCRFLSSSVAELTAVRQVYVSICVLLCLYVLLGNHLLDLSNGHIYIYIYIIKPYIYIWFKKLTLLTNSNYLQ